MSKPAAERPSEAPTLPPSAQADEAATLPPEAPAEAATLPPAHAGVAADLALSPDGPPATVPGYEILGELGRGGMGVVYKARQTALQRLVALKMILAGGHAGADGLQRFRTEAEAIARLQHPHIVQIHEVGEHQGLPYFSLEFCSGGSLEKKLQGTPLPPKEAAALVEQLAQAMQAAHQKGVIHRDLKPANVLLTEDGVPKITDFGLAKKLDEAGRTASGAVMGTPSYMAPEQAGGQSQELRPACDVYALGAILYECLTGRPPFRAATPLDTILQVVSQEPVSVTQLNGLVPRDLETICLKCLQKEPRKRYASAAALAGDLRRFQAGEPITARPVGRGERLVKWVKRRPAVAALLGMVLLLTAAGLSGITWAYGQALRERKNAQQERDNALSAEAETRAQKEAAEKAEAKAKQQEQLARQRELVARHYWYGATLNLAQQALESNDGPRLISLLERQRPQPGQDDLRSFEWYYLWRLGRAEKRTLRAHTQPISCLAYSPDGKLLVTATGQQQPLVRQLGEVKLWDVATGRVRHTLTGFPSGVVTATFSADGKTLITAAKGHPSYTEDSASAKIKLWDVSTGQVTAQVKDVAPQLTAMALTPDGRTLAIAMPVSSALSAKPARAILSDAALRRPGFVFVGILLWDLNQGLRPVAFTVKGRVFVPTSLSFAPDGKTLAAGGFGSAINIAEFQNKSGKGLDQEQLRKQMQKMESVVALWDTTTGQEKALLNVGTYGPGAVNSLPLVWTLDGQTLATFGSEHTIRLWDVHTGKERVTLHGHSKDCTSLAVAPNGRTLASASGDGTIKLWDLAGEREIATLRGHRGAVQCVAFAPDGSSLASGSADGIVNLWNAASRPGPTILTAQGQAFSRIPLSAPVAFAADGQTLCTALDNEVILWDVPTGRERRRLKPLAKADQTQTRSRFSGSWISAIALSANGTLLAAHCGKEVWVWDVATRKERAKLAGQGQASPLLFTPDGKRLVAGGKVWDVDTWQGQTKHHPDQLSQTLAFSPDGERFVTLTPAGDSRTGVLVVRDMGTGAVRNTFEGTGPAVNARTFTWNGQSAACTLVDGTVRVWDVANGREQAVLKGHAAQIIALALSPDGRTVATASGDGSVKLWDPVTGQERLTLAHEDRIALGLAFSPDGKTLAVGWGHSSQNLLAQGVATLYRATAEDRE